MDKSIIKKTCLSCKYHEKCGAFVQTTKHINKREQLFPSEVKLVALNAIYKTLAKYCKEYKRG